MTKHYTHQAVSDLKGPLTIVSGKKRRITFIEVPSKDLTAMVDVAKVADLVLMVVDASFGFEMVHFPLR
jgi:ribosome biogenesis protein BMS1